MNALANRSGLSSLARQIALALISVSRAVEPASQKECQMKKFSFLYIRDLTKRIHTFRHTRQSTRHAADRGSAPRSAPCSQSSLTRQASCHQHNIHILFLTLLPARVCTPARQLVHGAHIPALERRAGMYRGYDSVIRSMEEGVDPPAASVCANHPHSDMARATPLTGSLKDPRGRRCQARKTLAQEAAARRCYSKVSGPSWPLGALGGNWLWVGIVGSRIKLGERGLGGKQHSGHGRLGAHL